MRARRRDDAVARGPVADAGLRCGRVDRLTRALPTLLALAAALPFTAAAQPDVPERQIPPEVVTGLRLLERDFTRALSQDCAPERCYAKGCLYVAHSVVERPPAGSLPGFNLGALPAGDEKGQVYLTTAECAFAYEGSVRARDARALATRLKAKLSKGWTQVDVVYEALDPLPDELAEPPEEPESTIPEEVLDEVLDLEPDAGVAAPPKPPPAWDAAQAGRELWTNLLPHFAWMIAVVLLTFAALLLIWALRRLGRQSVEEQVLLAQMLNEGNGGEGEADAASAEVPEADPVAEQKARWRRRLARSGDADPALTALVSDLLRRGEHKLLAKAVTLFPDEMAGAFPTSGALASAKFEVATVLKTTDPAALPSDAVFFDKLNRYALASLLTAHPDTDLIRGLHDEFGSRALADLVARLAPRHAALLNALAPAAMQHEAADLLTPAQCATIADQLLRSNRIDPTETDYLLQVLAAVREDAPLPAAPAERPVSDRGTEFAAQAALSALLPGLAPDTRGRLFDAAAERLNGRLPTWVRGVLYPDMLLALDPTTRNDLLLEAEPQHLAAWLAAQPDPVARRLLDGAPTSLRAALSGQRTPDDPDALHALAHEGRLELSAALQRRTHRGGQALRALLA